MHISIVGTHELKQVAGRLRKGAKSVTREFESELRKPTRDARDDVRNAILRADMRGYRYPRAKSRFGYRSPSRGVKRPTARAVQGSVSITAGEPVARVVFRESDMPYRIRQLFPYFVGIRTRLRHPIMGDPELWVSQRIPNVWWKRLRRHIPKFRRAGERALENVARIIEKG